MTKLQLSRKLAEIVVYGHVLLFLYGFIMWKYGTLEDSDTIQLILMGSPLLALVSIAAFRFIMRGQVDDNSAPAEPTMKRMSLVITVGFVAMLFVAYTTTLFSTTISAPDIKFVVGVIETALGAYIGVVKDTFFPAE